MSLENLPWMYSYTWSLSTDSGICPLYLFLKLGIIGVGVGCSSVAKHFCSVCKALGFVSSTVIATGRQVIMYKPGITVTAFLSNSLDFCHGHCSQEMSKVGELPQFWQSLFRVFREVTAALFGLLRSLRRRPGNCAIVTLKQAASTGKPS